MRAALWLSAFLVIGCSSPDQATSTSPSTPSTTSTTQASTDAAPITNATAPPPPAATTPAAGGQASSDSDMYSELVNTDGHIDPGLPKSAGWGAKMPKDGDPIAILTTNEGRIVVKFFPEVAPNHVKNFLKLAKKGFYDGTKFHRVIPGFMIQGGDPNTIKGDPSTWGQGGPGYNVKHEFNDVLHTPGILSMARTGDPDGAGSQFFIMVAKYPSLDHQYTVFGQVIEGEPVADAIVSSPTGDNDRPLKDQVLQKVEVTKWPVKLKD